VKWLAVIALLVAGCSDPSDTQYLPIGSRCSSDTQCGTSPFHCNMGPGYMNGYCEKPCTTDGDCPQDSLCGTTAPKACRRVCSDVSECRGSEGYVCTALTTGKTVCDAPSPSAWMDGRAR
jgi:hypothetical protein